MKLSKMFSSFLILSLILSTTLSFAQKTNADKKNNRYKGVVMVKAIENGSKYKLSFDAGKDKDGKNRAVYQSDKEKSLVDKVIKSGSLVDALNLFVKRGYSIESAYIIPGDAITHVFILVPGGNGKAAAGQKPGRAQKQNGPKMNPAKMDRTK